MNNFHPAGSFQDFHHFHFLSVTAGIECVLEKWYMTAWYFNFYPIQYILFILQHRLRARKSGIETNIKNWGALQNINVSLWELTSFLSRVGLKFPCISPNFVELGRILNGESWVVFLMAVMLIKFMTNIYTQTQSG